ncbi:hypothetical protein [Methanobrevibacter cuticularis]|nr:hypothetical protein [Methanobrevibacter cuticularis]
MEKEGMLLFALQENYDVETWKNNEYSHFKIKENNNEGFEVSIIESKKLKKIKMGQKYILNLKIIIVNQIL